MALMVFKNRPVEVLAESGTLSKVAEGGNEFWVKSQSLKPQPKRRPTSLTVMEMSDPLKPFVEYLKTPEAQTKLMLEAQCEEMDFAVRKQYAALTGGDRLELGHGYNVAPPSAGKQGCEGSVTFKMPENLELIPSEVVGMMTQRKGLINRIGFVWLLVEQGFRVTRRPLVRVMEPLSYLP